jgi:hypothetical protein
MAELNLFAFNHSLLAGPEHRHLPTVQHKHSTKCINFAVGLDKYSLGWFKPWVFLREVFLNGLSLFKQI